MTYRARSLITPDPLPNTLDRFGAIEGDLRRLVAVLKKTPDACEIAGARTLAHRALAGIADLSALVDGKRPESPRARGARRVLIGPRGNWFSVDGGTAVCLERRRALRAVLIALASGAREGRSLSNAELRLAGWPDERLIDRAGDVRVRNAIATLRRLGLRGCIVTTGEGYRLSIEVALDDGGTSANDSR